MPCVRNIFEMIFRKTTMYRMYIYVYAYTYMWYFKNVFKPVFVRHAWGNLECFPSLGSDPLFFLCSLLTCSTGSLLLASATFPHLGYQWGVFWVSDALLIGLFYIDVRAPYRNAVGLLGCLYTLMYLLCFDTYIIFGYYLWYIYFSYYVCFK